MTNNDRIVRVNGSFLDLTQVLSRRLLWLTILTLFLGTLLTVASLPALAQTIVPRWPGCPHGSQVKPYSFTPDPRPAHFQTSPVASPFGGNCSLDVISGSVFSGAGTYGGFLFYTPEAAAGSYTIAFDMQWVSGELPWGFVNETAGDSDTNNFGFEVPYPGNRCWHHYEYTAATGPTSCLAITPQACAGAAGTIDGTCPSTAPVCSNANNGNSCVGVSAQACAGQPASLPPEQRSGSCQDNQVCIGGAKQVMYVSQNTGAPGSQEMRIANVTMWQADNATPQGFAPVVSEACGSCCEQPKEWTTNAYSSFHVRLPIDKDSYPCLTESEGAVINKCNYEVSVVFDSPVIFRKDPIVHNITAQNYVHGTGTVGATCNIWSYDGNGGGKEGTNSTFNPQGAQALTFTSLKFGNTISLLCDLPVGEGISALHWSP